MVQSVLGFRYLNSIAVFGRIAVAKYYNWILNTNTKLVKFGSRYLYQLYLDATDFCFRKRTLSYEFVGEWD